MTLDGKAVEIVGVMPPGMDVPRGAEFWMPATPILASGTPPDVTALDRVGVSYVIGRARSGLEPAEVRRELDALEARLDAGNPGRPKWARPLSPRLRGSCPRPVRPALRVLWVAVVVLLLVAALTSRASC
jgi:hypothetical protein